jgi:RNA-directed DNA polymerase
VSGGDPHARAGCQKPVKRREPYNGEQARGPQHEVKPAASTHSQSGGRAAHFTAKAISAAGVPKLVADSGGVWGAARVHGRVRNTGGPSAQPSSRQGLSYKARPKSKPVQRESEGATVPKTGARASGTNAVKNNAAGGRGPCFGHVVEGGKGEGMAGETGSNQPPGRRPVDKVRQLQRRLWAAAKRAPGRRFHALYDRIHRSDVLREAWKRVRRNRGSAGLDAQSIADVEQYGVERFLEELGADLRAGGYRPQAVMRRYIPKADGRRRPLGIPTVRDRVAQMAAKLVLEPIFEADFLPCSYGFRPKRSATMALEALRKAGAKSGHHVLDADIRDYFGSIDHDKLMKLVGRRVTDPRVLKLLRQWLAAGVMEDGVESQTISGAPQGGVISPLLSNIYLSVLDTLWMRKSAPLGTLVRYCDDFVVICRTKSECEQAEKRIRVILERLGLELHPEKTRRVELYDGKQGFDFLGCHLHKRLSGHIWERERKRVYFLHRWPSERSMKRIRQKVKELTPRGRCHADIRDVITDLNPVLRGWGNYFRTGNAAGRFGQLDDYVVHRLRGLRVKRKGRHLQPGEARRWDRDYFEALGLHRLRGTVRYPERVNYRGPERPSASRVREIRTHGLKGGPAFRLLREQE